MTGSLLYLALGAALTISSPEAPVKGPAVDTVVIPPSSTSALRSVIGTEAGKLDGRLVLQQAQIDRASVTILFGKALDSVTVIKVSLGHACPEERTDCRQAGPFVLTAVEGDDEPAVDALIRRLSRLTASQIWKKIPAEIEQAEPTQDTSAEDDERARDTQLKLLKAEHAAMLGQKDDAKEALIALGKAEQTSTSMLLSVAEALWEVEAPGDATAVVARWREGVGEDADPIGAWRAKALSGEAVSVPEILETLVGTDAECDIRHIATSMSVSGARQQAYLLLEGAAPKTDCIDIEVTLARWFVEDMRRDEAKELTGLLMAHAPEHDEVRSLRAQLLMGDGQFKEAAAVLEVAAWKDPESGLLSALIGAYQRIEDPPWQEKKLAELKARAAKDVNDHVAAFLVGVKLHYRGDFSASDTYLTRVATTFYEQPRMHIYRGMNAFNMGEKDRALEHIQTAMNLEAPDPDVYYCRAELRRWFDVPGAIADLNRYLIQSNAGGTTNPAKQERVNRIIKSLQGCIDRGDPIPCEAPLEHPRGHPANRDPFATSDWTDLSGARLLQIAGVILLIFVILRQRRINQRQ